MGKSESSNSRSMGETKDINHELADIIISTGCFNKDSLLTGKGEADVIIEDYHNNKWYFEIKQSSWQGGKFFDAATLTQWSAWDANRERYYFVFITGKDAGNRKFTFIRASDLMAHSSVPPFKIYFNIYRDEVIDNFVGARDFKEQVERLYGSRDESLLPSLQPHSYKRKRQENDESAVKLVNIPIKTLQKKFDELIVISDKAKDSN